MNEGTSKLRTEACNKALFKKHTGYFHNYTDMSGIFVLKIIHMCPRQYQFSRYSDVAGTT